MIIWFIYCILYTSKMFPMQKVFFHGKNITLTVYSSCTLDILSFFSQNVNNHLSLVITLHPLNSNSITNNKTVRCPYTETISCITEYLNNSYLSLYINMCWRQTYLVAGYAVCTLANTHICWWWCTFVAGASIDWNYKIPQAKDLFQSILVVSNMNSTTNDLRHDWSLHAWKSFCIDNSNANNLIVGFRHSLA